MVSAVSPVIRSKRSVGRPRTSLRDLQQGGADPLSHVHSRRPHQHAAIRLQREDGPGVVDLSFAGSHVLEAARYPDAQSPAGPGAGGQGGELQRQGIPGGDDGGAGGDAGPEDLTRDGGISHVQGVAQAELERIEPQPPGALIEQTLDGHGGLVDAEATEGASVGVVRVDGPALHPQIGHAVRPAREDAGLVDHSGAQCGVRSGVGEQRGVYGQDVPFGVEADGVVELVGVSLGAHADGLRSAQGQLHRPLKEVGGHAGESLHRVVQLAAEGSAEWRGGHAHLLLRQVEHRGQLAAELERELGGRAQEDATVTVGLGQGRLRLQVGVLDEGRLEATSHHHGRAGQGRSGVPHLVYQVFAYVAALMKLRRLRRESLSGGEDARELAVGHRDRLDRVARGRMGVGHDHGHGVSDVSHAVGAQHGLVRLERAHAVVAGHVRGGEHGADTRHRPGRVAVDLQDLSMGVGTPRDGGVEYPGRGEVVREGERSQHLVDSVEVGDRGAQTGLVEV